MHAQELSPALLHDARLMIDALMADLGALQRFELTTTRDERLPAGPDPAVAVGGREPVWDIWHRCLCNADAAWFIAPETDGVLLQIRQLADAAGCRFLGCGPEAIKIASSKKACADYLGKWDIPIVPTRWAGEGLPASDSGWVVKPDDGAGCESTRYITEARQFESWKNNEKAPQRFVVQPRVDGIPASLSVVYHEGRARLLAANLQHVRFVDGLVVHAGVTVNGLRQKREELQELALEVGKRLPGLQGYVGIDFILTDAGPVLVEINPRLTTSYAGLSRSLKQNAAGVILRHTGVLGPGEEQEFYPYQPVTLHSHHA